MVEANVKRYIESIVNQQYQEIDSKDINNNRLKKKIDCFVKFIYIGLENEKYKEKMEEIASELDRIAVQEGRISFQIVGKLDFLIDILNNYGNLGINENNRIQILKKLNITDKDEIINNIDNVIKNNKNSIEEKIEIISAYLKDMNKPYLLPYAKAFIICSNANLINDKIPINYYWDYVSSLFITFIDLVYKMQDEIMDIYVDKKIHVEEYISNIIKNYESKVNFKYIPSSVVKLDLNYSVEEFNKYDKEEEQYIPFIDINQDEALKKIKLVGYAGVGKTTTLEYIEYTDAINYKIKKKIPIIISLITVEHKEYIQNLILKKFGLDQSDLDIVNYLIEENKINLYLDGINELNILDIFEKRDFLNELENFIMSKENKDLKVVITDRDNDDVSILNNSDTFLIQGMTESDIDAFIEGNSSKDKVDKIKEIVKGNEEYEDMIIHPIMLKNLITIIECNKPIPLSKEELSEVYLQAIIDREINEKKDLLAKYINGALTYLVKSAVEKTDWTSNMPTSYFNVIDTFYDYAKDNNIEFTPESGDAEDLLTLIRKMGILKEVEFQKYAFTDERFFNIYYKYAVLDKGKEE